MPSASMKMPCSAPSWRAALRVLPCKLGAMFMNGSSWMPPTGLHSDPTSVTSIGSPDVFVTA